MMEHAFSLSPSQLQQRIAELTEKLESEGLEKEEKIELKELKQILDNDYMTDYLDF